MPAWLATLAIFALVVVLCELIPKLLAISTAYRISAVGVFTLKAMMPLLDRVGQVLENASSMVIDLLTPEKLRVRPRISDEELETLVEMGEAEGTLQEAEGEMIQEIIKLGDKTAKDCMTPRVDTCAIPDDLPNEEAIARFRQWRYRRVPVYADTPDQILGIVDVKQFLLDPSPHYTETLNVPSYVPETMRAMDLLRRFLSAPQGLAIVVDEFGGTEGIITLADIVEEIISDAAPLGDADLYIEPLDDGRFIVSGNARLDDLTEHLGFELLADGIDTIGGYVFNQLGYLPTAGATLEIPRLSITVRRVSHQRIEEMLLEKTGAGAEEDSSDELDSERMMGWPVIILCWVVSFVFAGIEAGLLSLDQVRLRHQVKLRNRAAIALDRLLKKPQRLLATVLLVTNFSDIAGLLLLTRRLVTSFGSSGFLLALLVAAPIYLFLLGVLPKSLFRRFPYRALAAFAGLLVFTSRLLWPVLELGSQIGHLLFRHDKATPRLFAAREDLKQLTFESERQGALTPAERAMIHNVVDFRTVRVADVMMPLSRIIAVTPQATIPELLQKTAKTGVNRVPVITDNGTAVGLVNVFDILLDRNSGQELRHYTRRIVSASESESAYRIIRRLRAARLSLAAVLDEQQKLTGVVTVEDLIRRLVQSA